MLSRTTSPAAANPYCEGFDRNGQWEASMGNLALASGYIVDLGQVPDWMKRQLNSFVKKGLMVRYRGHWDTLHASFGMGPLKTIWAIPEIAEKVAELDNAFKVSGRKLVHDEETGLSVEVAA